MRHGLLPLAAVLGEQLRPPAERQVRVYVGGNGSVNTADTKNKAKIKLALEGGTSPSDQFNQHYVAAQLSLLTEPHGGAGALRSPLVCHRLDFAPFRTSLGDQLSPNSTLGDLKTAVDDAAQYGNAADLSALAGILDALNSNNPLGRCQ